MTIDYDQLKILVKEAMFTGGGINEPSAPEGIPHRMPAAEPSKRTGDQEANELYGVALVAREATEKLVVALDNPIFDDAYESAFKASACLRKVLNSLEGSGAEPSPEDRVVAPPQWQQPYNAGGGDFAGGAAGVIYPGFLDEVAGQTPPDVQRKHAILDKAPQIDAASEKIDTRPEFELDLAKFVEDAATRVKPGDMVTALTKVLTNLRKMK
tara:strand:+ start:775 stop:1410 length:636 start_codon:yes stop_codon:yes gene_type:complete